MIDPSKIRNVSHVDFNKKNLDNVRFVEVTSNAAVGEHLKAKNIVEESLYNSVDESTLLRLDSNQELKLDEQDSLVLNSTLESPKTVIGKSTEAYVAPLSEN